MKLPQTVAPAPPPCSSLRVVGVAVLLAVASGGANVPDTKGTALPYATNTAQRLGTLSYVMTQPPGGTLEVKVLLAAGMPHLR